MIKYLNIDSDFSIAIDEILWQQTITSQIDTLYSDYTYVKRSRRNFKDKEFDSKLLIIEYIFDNFYGKHPLKFQNKEISESLKKSLELKRKFKNNYRNEHQIDPKDINLKDFNSLGLEEKIFLVQTITLLATDKLCKHNTNNSNLILPTHHKPLGRDVEGMEYQCYNLHEIVIQKQSLEFNRKAQNTYKNPKLSDIQESIENNYIQIIEDLDCCEQIIDSMEFEIIAKTPDQIDKLIQKFNETHINETLSENLSLYKMDAEWYTLNPVIATMIEIITNELDCRNNTTIDKEKENKQEMEEEYEKLLQEFNTKNTLGNLGINLPGIINTSCQDSDIKTRKTQLQRLVDLNKQAMRKKQYIDTFVTMQGIIKIDKNISIINMNGFWKYEPNGLYGDEVFVFEYNKNQDIDLDNSNTTDSISQSQQLKYALTGIQEGSFWHKTMRVEEQMDLVVFKLSETGLEFQGQIINEQCAANVRGKATQKGKSEDGGCDEYNMELLRVVEETDVHASDDTELIKRKRDVCEV